MESKTRGIVIRTIKYGEASAISHIYTEQFGLTGFHIPSAYKNKGKVKMSYLQPLNAVELSFSQSRSRQLQRISDISCLFAPDTSGFRKQAFSMVLTEILQQTLRENETNPSLFNYLYAEALPGLQSDIHFWQLPFVMLNILHHYGCAPNTDTYTEGSFLDLQNGVFLETLLPLKHIAGRENSLVIHEILTRGIMHLEQDATLRSAVTDDLVRYFRCHVRDHFELHSREVFSAMKI